MEGSMLTSRTCPYMDKDHDPNDLIFIYDNGVPLHIVGWLVSGIFTLQASIVTLYLIKQHWKYYYEPSQQRYIVRLLLIVPMYTIFNWLSYFFFHESVYIDTFRDAYQAYAITSFFNLLLHCLGENDEIRMRKLSTISSTRSPAPFCCIFFNPSEHRTLLKRLRFGILQYVVILYATTFIALILEAAGVYCQDLYSIYFPQIYLVIVQTISGFIANICMNMLFTPVQEILAKEYPWFLRNICVNTALFLVTYQGHALGFLVSLGYIRETQYWTAHNISTGIQALLVSVELAIISLIQMKAFRYRDYRPDPRKPTVILESMKDSLIPTDLYRDFSYAIRYIFNRVLRRPTISDLWPNDRPTPEPIPPPKPTFWERLTNPFVKLFQRPQENVPIQPQRPATPVHTINIGNVEVSWKKKKSNEINDNQV
ncbi:44008_t:CDS:2 [Gigaspora margarita]|uniref:44008_t:CDS:1 n=1 Tax=Gigaspora margarita TaxID=4874 RepID=A0ABN7ULW6_GIGMA|nr:44008_t:CDS:2 [Gigaspora margarita]